MKTISLVIPVYYNEGSLLPLFAELQRVEQRLNEQQLALQLIFVDDGSGDESLQRLLLIKQQRPETKVIKLARNFGAVSATKTGLSFITGDCFMLLAADLQDPPDIILEMAQHWVNGSPYIIAVRRTREDPFLTRLYAGVYYRILRKLVVPQYPLKGFDMFMLDAKALPYMRDSSKNMNPSLLSYWLGFKPVVLEYDRRERDHGKSRWSFSKRVKFLLDSLLGFSVLPLRMISLVGFFVSLISFAYGTVVTINSLVGNRDVAGFPTLVALITFLLGLIIIMLGLIGEYLWRIFEQLNHRPEAVIDEVY
jgi:glycosyltransferase involved in cell wall biosynthesis